MSGTSLSISHTRSAAVFDIVIITKTIDSIIRLISICIVYVIMLTRFPVIISPPTISFAPSHDETRIHVNTQNCISGLLKASNFSTFVKSLYISFEEASNFSIS